jgi:hypothetical protein
MNARLVSTMAILLAATGIAVAQADSHHPAAPAAAEIDAMPPPPPDLNAMMQGCMTMMQGMQGMMRGMQGMPMQEGMRQLMPMQDTSDAAMAYMAAMAKMDAPMMQAMREADPDVAFVRAMIPHHQGAIDMARVVLQYGKDATVRVWANQIIAAQEKEIAEMQEWLKNACSASARRCSP